MPWVEVYSTDYSDQPADSGPPNGTTQRGKTDNTIWEVEADGIFTGGAKFRMGVNGVTDSVDRLVSIDDLNAEDLVRIRGRAQINRNAGVLFILDLRFNMDTGTGDQDASRHGYQLFLLNDDDFRLARYNNGSFTGLVGPVGTGFALETNNLILATIETDFFEYDVWILDDGSGDPVINMKVWADGDPEPTTLGPGWVEFTDTSVDAISTGSFSGIGTRAQNDTSNASADVTTAFVFEESSIPSIPPPVPAAQASLTWDDGSGVQEILLPYPLFFREGSYSRPKTRRSAGAVDKVTFSTEIIPGGAEMVIASLRFFGDPASLLDMLEAGADGHIITYIPNIDVPSNAYPFRLDNHTELVSIRPDRDRFGGGEWEVTLAMNRIDGGSLAGLFPSKVVT